MFLIPDWSQRQLFYSNSVLHTIWKLYSNYQRYYKLVISSMYPEHPQRSLGGRSWFLIGVKVDYHISNGLLIPYGDCIRILKASATI